MPINNPFPRKDHFHPSNIPVAVADLSVVFGEVQVLDRVSFKVNPGETVALTGTNGSGKSTLVKTILGINSAHSGSIEIFGFDASRRASNVAWEHVGYVPQRPPSFPPVPATAAEVVATGLLHGKRLRNRSADRIAVLEALSQVGLEDRADDTMRYFSGGQQQRVLIARALIRQPELIIMDEPLTGIDRESRQALAYTLQVLKNSSHSLLLVLHEMGELAHLIDRKITLDQGVLVEGRG